MHTNAENEGNAFHTIPGHCLFRGSYQPVSVAIWS